MTAALQVGAAPEELVPGSPARLDLLAARCRTMSEGLAGAAARLRAVEAGDWVGPAGDAFRDVLDAEPARCESAAHAFGATGRAVASYADVLREAQGDAGRAVSLHEEAARRSAAWRDLLPRPPGDDPGDADRARAGALLADARARVGAAGERAARAVAAGWADAPREPRWWESAGHVVAEIGRGAWEATTGLVEFVWTVSPLRATVDPTGWTRDVAAIGEGLAFGLAHPVELGKALVDWETWQESPGRAIGHLVPDLLLALGTAGSGAVAARGARAADTLGDLGQVSTAFDRLDRAGESGQRMSYLDRARARLAGTDPLPEPNLPPGSPAGLAAANQGAPPYTGVDRWWTARLSVGDEIAAGSVAGRQLPFSGFAVPRSVADDVVTDATRLYEGVQVRPYRGTYRDELTVLRSRADLDVGVGYALANEQFGPGGLRQLFVPDLDRLVREGVLEVVERRPMEHTTARVGSEVAAP